MAEEDDERAMREAAEGDIISEPRLDRLRERLEKGAGGDTSETSRVSTEQTVASLANAINELAIGESAAIDLVKCRLTLACYRYGEFARLLREADGSVQNPIGDHLDVIRRFQIYNCSVSYPSSSYLLLLLCTYQPLPSFNFERKRCSASSSSSCGSRPLLSLLLLFPY